MKKFIKICLFLIVVAVLLFAGWKTISALAPKDAKVELAPGLSRSDISKTIGIAMKWDDSTVSAFASTFAQMQWAEFNSYFIPILSEKYQWSEEKKEIFTINSTKYFTRAELDFFDRIYVPGSYVIAPESSPAQVSGLLIARIKEANTTTLKDFISKNLSDDKLANLQKFINSQYELLPDLVPLPPQDIRIDKVDNKILMSFTTVYYNQGRGPLELLADPKTKGQRKDMERDVFQRVYLPGGKYRDRVAGTFMWHQSHLHYHFADFILYDLEAVDVQGPVPDLSGVLAKSTFCIRDISRVELDLPNTEKDAVYEICGKEKQGISVGWGDAYFYNYPDQNLNITDLPSGTYKLTFKANPDNRFDEVTTENNISSTLMHIDVEKKKVTIIENVPDKIPKFEHVYPVQENCAVCTL